MGKTTASAFNTWESNRQVFPLAAAGGCRFLFYYGSSACVQDVSVGNVRRVPCSTCKRKMQSLGLRGCLVFPPELRFCFKNSLAEELPCCGETFRKEETQPAFFQARWSSSVAFRDLWDYRKGGTGQDGLRSWGVSSRIRPCWFPHWFPHSFRCGDLPVLRGLCSSFPR